MRCPFVVTVGVLRGLLAVGLIVGLAGCDSSGSQETESDSAPAVDRTVEGDLMDRIETLHDRMPGEDSDGFEPPTDMELRHWQSLVGTLLEDDTTGAREIIEEHFPFYDLIRFNDTTTGDTYLLLQEASTVEKGWGTVVINPSSTRNLVVEVSHPMFDLNTDREGTALFRRTGARALLLAGTHRCANEPASPCDGESGVCGATQSYRQSDAAHVVTAPFQATHEELVDRYPDLTALSLHGNGRESCETVFLSDGVTDETSETIQALRQALAERGVQAGVPGTSSCPLEGTTNVQGRYTNGSDEPCTAAATSATGTFVHIEQRLDFRQSPNKYGALIEAVNATFE